MKKLLLGLLVLGSFSVFAESFKMSFNTTSITVKHKGESIRLLADNGKYDSAKRNANFFCTSKGYDKASDFIVVLDRSIRKAADINPNGSVILPLTIWNNTPDTNNVIEIVECEKSV
jgi:hypothetical protein